MWFGVCWLIYLLGGIILVLLLQNHSSVILTCHTCLIMRQFLPIQGVQRTLFLSEAVKVYNPYLSGHVTQ